METSGRWRQGKKNGFRWGRIVYDRRFLRNDMCNYITFNREAALLRVLCVGCGSPKLYRDTMANRKQPSRVSKKLC